MAAVTGSDEGSLRWWGPVAFTCLLLLVLSPVLSWWSPWAFAWLLPIYTLLVAGFGLLTLLLYGVPLVWATRFDRAERARGEEKPSLEIDLPGEDGRIVVMIHGTYARENEWSLPASPLGQALAPGAGLARLCWSGANSMRCRGLAARALRVELAALAERGYRHIALVAHSHGGNIALKACEDAATAARVSAIVCIATPFLTAWRPRLKRVGNLATRLGLVVQSLGLGMGFMLIGSTLVGPLDELGATRTLVATAASMALGLGIGLAGVLMALRLRFDDPRQALDPDIADAVFDGQAVAALRGRTLVVTRGGDEADGVLKLASLANRQIVSLANRDLRGRQREGLLDEAPRGLGGLMQGMAFGGLALLGAIPSLAFGVNALRSQTGVFLTSAETPPGAWTHQHFSGTTTSDGEGLYHSSLYADAEVVASIRHWLTERAVLAAPAPLHRDQT